MIKLNKTFQNGTIIQLIVASVMDYAVKSSYSSYSYRGSASFTSLSMFTYAAAAFGIASAVYNVSLKFGHSSY